MLITGPTLGPPLKTPQPVSGHRVARREEKRKEQMRIEVNKQRLEIYALSKGLQADRSPARVRLGGFFKERRRGHPALLQSGV